MANPDVSAKAFLNELMALSLHLIWKDPFYANTNEPDNIRIDAETYVAARNGELRFTSVLQFHEQVLQAFFPNSDELAIVLLDKKMIPEEMRDAIVAAEAAFVIDNWENKGAEPNAYYRMLYGLPPLNTPESDFVYNDRYADIDMETPVHLLPYTERLKLENRGFFDELLAQDAHKDDLYLKYLGKYRIYPYISRQAEPYELLYIQQSTYTYLRNDFIDMYEQARRMVLRVYYTDAYRNKSHLYEGFLGLCILFITQQRLHAKYLEADITRDFYDLESLKLLYDAYGMPFYSSIPLKYHSKIVKRLNELISYKGSTQVFYDLFELFDFGRMDAFEYYLVKERKTDEDGNPIFRDADGNPLSAEDMWNIRFAKVAWKEDKFVELTNPDNAVEYDKLTTVDPYWVEDEDLKKKLFESDWNYFNSKYMGVQIMFDLSKLMFETCYFLRMLQDNRNELSKLTTYYMMTGEDYPIFDMVIYAIALLCKNAGYTGEIPADPASVAAVYGFNFKEYNRLMKMGVDSMNDFVLNFKRVCTEYAQANPILAVDDTLFWMIDHITDGAFNYLGNDFPYGEWGYAPPPVFLHDYWPTENTVDAVKQYLRDTITVLQENPELTEYELMQLYATLVTHDNFEFNVLSDPSMGPQVYETFVVKSVDYNEEDLKVLRKAIIASYEQMLSWMIRLLDARTALTFDPHVMELIGNMNIDSVDDIDRLYENMVELDEYITYRIRTSVSKVDYEAFANLRKILMTTHLMDETFTKRNGTIASTYADLLLDINPQLYARLINDDIDTLTEEQYVIQTLMKLCDDLELLESANTSNIKRIVEYLFKILNFLKSAKVDLTEFQIIYMITDRGMNYIKFISELWEQNVTHLPWKVNREEFYLGDTGQPWATFIVQYFLERLSLVDKDHAMHVVQTIASIFEKLTDDAYQHSEMYGSSAFEYLFDWLHSELVHVYQREILPLIEKTQTDLAAKDVNAAMEWDTTVKPGEGFIKVLTKLIMMAKNGRYEITDAMISNLSVVKDGFERVVVGESAIYDAIFLKDSLIKISESYPDAASLYAADGSDLFTIEGGSLYSKLPADTE